MKKILIAFGSVVLAALLFTGGILANEWWLNFTGDDAIEESGEGVDRIMEILREVNEGKISAEDAVALLEVEKEELQGKIDKLENEGPPGLVKQINELKDKVKELESNIVQLTDDLEKANGIIGLRDNAIKGLEEERDNLQSDLTTVTQERDGLQSDLDNSNEYVTHLEAELERANTAVSSHADKVSKALDEAIEIQGDGND